MVVISVKEHSLFSQGLLKYFGNESKEASSVHPYQFVEEGAEPNHLSFWLCWNELAYFVVQGDQR